MLVVYEVPVGTEVVGQGVEAGDVEGGSLPGGAEGDMQGKMAGEVRGHCLGISMWRCKLWYLRWKYRTGSYMKFLW